MGGITSMVAPAFKVSFAQVEKAPPGVRLMATRRLPSCTAEQMEYERRTSSALMWARKVRCWPCWKRNCCCSSAGTSNVTAMVSRVSLRTLATDSG